MASGFTVEHWSLRGDFKGNQINECRGDRGYMGHGAIMDRAFKIC